MEKQEFDITGAVKTALTTLTLAIAEGEGKCDVVATQEAIAERLRTDLAECGIPPHLLFAAERNVMLGLVDASRPVFAQLAAEKAEELGLTDDDNIDDHEEAILAYIKEHAAGKIERGIPKAVWRTTEGEKGEIPEQEEGAHLVMQVVNAEGQDTDVLLSKNLERRD